MKARLLKIRRLW